MLSGVQHVWSYSFFSYFDNSCAIFSVQSSSSSLLSTGDGIETEAMYCAFTKLTTGESAFFSDAPDNYCVLRCMNPAAAARAVSGLRKHDMKRLGALTALFVISGRMPGRLNPPFINFLCYGCDFHSLTPEIIQDWLPGLYSIVRRWIEVGPTGELGPFQSHLASYHDIQVSRLINQLDIH